MINPFNLKTNNESELKFKKAILFFLSLISLILLIFGIYFIVNINKTATIEVLVSPVDATVKIGENTFNTKQTFHIEPGTYNITITRDGFNSYTGQIIAKKDETSYILQCLSKTPESNPNYNYNEYIDRCLAISDTEEDLKHNDYLNKNTNKIYSFTPFSSYSDGYRIYTENKTNENESKNKKITIVIYLYTCSDENSPKYQKYKQNALNKLKSFDINLDDYNIEYSNC